MRTIHVSTLFQSVHAKENYLRIQDDSLSNKKATVDIATDKNLKRLLEIEKALLKKPVSRVHLDTGMYEKSEGEVTYEEELIDFAKRLSDAKKHN
ncbi:unnamed protein product [Prunus armeniaca]|nr:hypothetical protein GBA52_023550 [Prunus armeniaca]